MRQRFGAVMLVLLLLGLAKPVNAQTLADAESGVTATATSSLTEGLVVPRDPFMQAVPPPAPVPPTPRHTGLKAMVKGLGRDVQALPSRENLMWAGIGGALALSAHPFDEHVNRALVGSAAAGRIFRPGAFLGESGTLLASATIVYSVGRLKDQPKVSHVGMDLIQALVISEGLTQALKYTVRRERPDRSDNNSFPSGHAADTFAFATALERHLGWRYAVPAYLFSSYVAISRLPADRHWLSDAVFGSAVGIIAGRTVTSNEAAPFPFAVVSVPRGVMVMYSPRNR